MVMSGQAPNASTPTNLVGSVLASRYRLLQLIGQGGMGRVYKAQDTAMSDRVVAVKVLAPHLVSDERQVMRFEQEARAANQLRHPNTISVLDFGRDSEGHIFMVIEFLTGETLTAILRRGRVGMSRCLYIFRQVCKSLAEAHSKNIVHRDLKPDNIFVCEIYGESDFVKVIDFGIAKFLEDESAQLTQAGKMFGTPRYLSPEQASGGALDNRSDLYSLGVIMFECITGRAPFLAAEPIAVAIKHVQEPAPRMEDVTDDISIPEQVDSLVFRLLQKKPEDRLQSAEEVVVAIDEAMAALQKAGVSLPLGQYTPHAAMTPVKETTIPPASSVRATRAMAIPETTVTGSGALLGGDSTRAIDPIDVVHDDATRALDTLRPSLVTEAAAATMALDTVDALKVLETSKAIAAPAEPEVTSSPQSNRRMVFVAVLFMLAMGLAGGWYWQQAQVQQQQLAAESAQAKRDAAQEAKARQEAERTTAARNEELAEAKRAKEKAAKREAKALAELAKTREDLKVHTVTIASNPAGATVSEGSKVLGVTPLKLTVKRIDPPKTLKLKLAGHKESVLEVKPATVVLTPDKTVTTLMVRRQSTPQKPKTAGAPSNKKQLDWGM
ncbi:MAG: hypothetical protein CMH53_05525 [Myxococcales bacterium]|nr:hypothetical protein [Myxococcales bacterium]